MTAGNGETTRSTFLARSAATAGTALFAPAPTTAASKKIQIAYARSLSVDTLIGPVDLTASPVKSVAITSLAGGQWRREGGNSPYGLKIMNNDTMPQWATDAGIVPLSP